MSGFITVILAAGKGTRMKSKLPKVLHKVGGKAMLECVIDVANKAGARRNIVVTGFGGATVRQQLAGTVEFCEQSEQLGTGHAVLQTQSMLEDERGTVMVLCGDTPLLTSDMLARFYYEHQVSGAKATVLTAIMPDATGYGRIIRADDGTVAKIQEHKDAAPDELKINEVNSGIYCFELPELFRALGKVTNNNAQGEYYLPDVVQILRSESEKIWAVIADDYESTLGINSRSQLAEAEKILRQRKNEELMMSGVTIIDPNTTFIDTDVVIGQDTVIYPFTLLEGKTVIGEDCIIGPQVRFQNMTVGNGVQAQYTYAHNAKIDDEVNLGQFTHIRQDTYLAARVKIGNFVEVKNSSIGKGSKLPHLSYIGDTDMGSGVNMGCGTITVNYDGKNKYRTVIGDNAFVGCNSNLIAPITVEADSYIGAGSTITHNVPSKALAISRVRQKNIEGWQDKRTT